MPTGGACVAQVRAVQLLIRCRRTLAFTFVYAFFIKDDDARKLFEFAQGELEKYTVGVCACLQATVLCFVGVSVSHCCPCFIMTPMDLQERFSALVEKEDLDEVLKSKDDILRWTVELNKYLVSHGSRENAAAILRLQCIAAHGALWT